MVKKLSATNRDLFVANQLLLDRSVQDSLTGLSKSFTFSTDSCPTLHRDIAAHTATSLLFIDLDYLKINDLYGHRVGDQVLREIGWL